MLILWTTWFFPKLYIRSFPCIPNRVVSNMFNFSNSWEITKACFKVVWEEKILILFPLIAMLTTGLAMTFLVGCFIIWSFWVDLFGGSGYIVYLVFSFLYYFFMYTIAIFSNVAIIGCAKIKLEGGKPTLKDGFDLAFKRIGAIVAWGAVSATVGIILQLIRDIRYIGPIISNLLGLAWSILTYFVVPIIAYENLNPFAAIGKSKDLLAKSWGTALVANFSMGLIFFLCCIPVFLVLLVLFFGSIATGSIFVILGVIGLCVLVFVFLSAVYTALKSVLMTVLYRYATTGETGFGFSESTVRGMFVQKQKRGIFG